MFEGIDWNKMTKQSKLKKRDIAYWIDVSQTTYSLFLAGKMEFDEARLAKLQQVLEIAIDSVRRIGQVAAE